MDKNSKKTVPYIPYEAPAAQTAISGGKEKPKPEPPAEAYAAPGHGTGIRIAVLCSGGGTNLQALLNAQERGELHSGEIVLVVGNKEGIYAFERARRAGIKTVFIRNDEERLIQCLQEEGIELIILAGYLAILSAEFTRRFPERIINIHPSLIPSFCGKGYYGLRVHEAALAYGVKLTGATVHFVNEIPDGGRIILQKAVEVREDDSPESLQQRVMEETEWELLPRAAELVSARLLAEASLGEAPRSHTGAAEAVLTNKTASSGMGIAGAEAALTGARASNAEGGRGNEQADDTRGGERR